MNDNGSPSFTESPVSWNTRYITGEGFECQLTLRGESGQDVLERANSAMGYLLKNGCKPYTFSKPYPRTQKADNGNDTTHTCPIHNVEMRRFEKDGRTWFAHKVDDGWCNGKGK